MRARRSSAPVDRPPTAPLNELSGREPFEVPEQAYAGLRAVLHAVRDRLTVEEAAHLGAQLPQLVRGIYYEGWRPSMAPNDEKTVDEFLAHVRSSLGGNPQERLPLEPATRTILAFLAEHVDPGEMRHVVDQMPKDIKGLFAETPAA
ncbi:MAG: DUF2267 domain-containing protein [Gemmatimonadetes bacterium]|nr:DUF2267 domain-containing protein [Gemmatimonadota bacterium]